MEDYPQDVAGQIDALPREAWIDFEAATAFILQRPFEGELFVPHQRGGTRARTFGLGMGLVLYWVRPDTNRDQHEQVSYLAY